MTRGGEGDSGSLDSDARRRLWVACRSAATRKTIPRIRACRVPGGERIRQRDRMERWRIGAQLPPPPAGRGVNRKVTELFGDRAGCVVIWWSPHRRTG